MFEMTGKCSVDPMLAVAGSDSHFATIFFKAMLC